MSTVILNLPADLTAALVADLMEATGLDEGPAEMAVDVAASRLIEAIATGAVLVRKVDVDTYSADERTVMPPDDVLDSVRVLMSEGLVIPAVKLIREHTTLGISEAKELAVRVAGGAVNVD